MLVKHQQERLTSKVVNKIELTLDHLNWNTSRTNFVWVFSDALGQIQIPRNQILTYHKIQLDYLIDSDFKQSAAKSPERSDLHRAFMLLFVFHALHLFMSKENAVSALQVEYSILSIVEWACS